MQPEIAAEANPNRRIARIAFIALAAIWFACCLSATSVGAGYLLGKSNGAAADPAFDPLFQTWDIIHTQYVNQPVDDKALIQGAINGMMQSLGDENSTYMDPDTYKSATSALEGYEGIGISVDTSGEYLTVISVFDGSPAEAAGLKSGDKIVKVDGTDMTGLSPEEVRKRMLGPAGSHIQLAVRREGEIELLEFDIVRAKIDPPVVDSRMLAGGIAYLYLGIFSESAGEQVAEALSQLMAEDPSGLILDLRQNSGGYVDSAVAVGSQFLAEYTLLLVEKDGSGKATNYYAKAGGLALTVPLVVLVDGGTASASEIVAGAIQDHQRGVLVGTTTYGKGSVQVWVPLVNDMGAIRITIALWYTPDGKQIAKQGLTPDYPVNISEEEFQAGKDPQLERAVQLLQEGKGV